MLTFSIDSKELTLVISGIWLNDPEKKGKDNVMVENRNSLIDTLDPPIACGAENQNFNSDDKKPGECFFFLVSYDKVQCKCC